MGFWASKTLLSAVELGVFTQLGRGPRTAAQLETRLGIHPRSARDFLDALVALQILERADEQYLNTPESAQFLDEAQPGYVGALLKMANTRLYSHWGSLTEALRTGKPQNEAKNGSQNQFEAIYEEPGAAFDCLRKP
jgi:hypothetical protein